jgi:hypothetical protein|tara:strand:+ start:238 stop:1320 length:1083 start_codon:yes stop_codon:yes gene_type:complete
MNNIVNELINTAKPKMFRGKPTNRKMLNMGVKYYDTNEIPYLKNIDPLIKKYFNIPDEYDNLFINVYEHNHSIGNHCDKDFGMDTTKNIISVSLGINNNHEIITGNQKIGWMKINDNKIDIINNKKIEFDYTTPHSAKTLIKKDLKYRVNFTFRASKKKKKIPKCLIIKGVKHYLVPTTKKYRKIIDYEDEVINEETMNYIYKIKKMTVKPVIINTPINDVFKNIDMRTLIFGFQKHLLSQDKEKYNTKVNDSDNNEETTTFGNLNIGDKVYHNYKIYEIVEKEDKKIKVILSDKEIIVLPHLRFEKNIYEKYVKNKNNESDVKICLYCTSNSICRSFKNQNLEIWKSCYTWDRHISNMS